VAIVATAAVWVLPLRTFRAQVASDPLANVVKELNLQLPLEAFFWQLVPADVAHMLLSYL
jgi:hypothetical protein